MRKASPTAKIYNSRRVSVLILLVGWAGCGETPVSEESPAEPAIEATESTVEPIEESEPEVSNSAPVSPDDEAEDERVQDSFLGQSDAARIDSLRQAQIAEVERGRGGRSLAFKVTLDDGTQGYFKPEQSFSGAHWYAELAAYYLDRTLKFGRTPPSIGRQFEWSSLRRAAGTDGRVSEVRVQPDGTVRGAFIWWMPERLVPLSTERGWESWVRVNGGIDLTPFQRPAEYRADIRRRNEGQAPERVNSRPDPDTRARPAELSDMILFDYLTSNVDRWGGDNTNIRTYGAGGPLVYLDNGAGFWPNAQVSLMETRLRMVQRFRRSTIDAVRDFNIDDFRARLSSDPMAPILDENLIQGVVERVQRVIAHAERMQERFGERIWFDEANQDSETVTELPVEP